MVSLPDKAQSTIGNIPEASYGNESFRGTCRRDCHIVCTVCDSVTTHTPNYVGSTYLAVTVAHMLAAGHHAALLTLGVAILAVRQWASRNMFEDDSLP